MGRKSQRQPTREEAFQSIVASAVDGKRLKVPCKPGQLHWREIREFFEKNCIKCKRNFHSAQAKLNHMTSSVHGEESCTGCHQELPEMGGAHEIEIPDELLDRFFQAIGHQPKP